MSDQVKNIMLNMYPKKRVVEDEGEVVIQEHPQYNYQGDNKENKEHKKWMFSAIIAGVCVFLFSSFFLDFVDEICMKRDTSAFNSKGEPRLYLVVTIFTIILLITRTFFSLV